MQNRFGSLRVEGAGCFVAQKYLRIACQGAGNAYTLFLAAGQLAGIVVGTAFQLYQLQQRTYALVDFALAQALDFQRKSDVIINSTACQQVEVLENHADALTCFTQLCFAHGGQLLTVNEYLACSRFFQHVDAAHQCGFAGTGKTDDTKNFASLDAQACFVQSMDVAGLAVVGFFYIN